MDQYIFKAPDNRRPVNARIDVRLYKVLSMIIESDNINSTDLFEQALWDFAAKKGFRENDIDTRVIGAINKKKDLLEIIVRGPRGYTAPPDEEE